mgnify:CR=1 FL=1
MSANNYILIEEKKNNWEVSERDIETDYIIGALNRKKHLEDAITLATLWMEEGEVEYGIQVKFLHKKHDTR